jgi:hypothetical protein
MSVNNELSAIQTEQQLIEVIGVHIISQLGGQRWHLENGDTQTFDFLSRQLQTFTYQSELAYQLLFPSVDSFLESVRILYSKTRDYSLEDDAPIKLIFP